MRFRLDVQLVTLGLAPTRAKAQALILSGDVLVNDEPITKAGHPLKGDEIVRIRGNTQPYVSRGGLKLVRALEDFSISVQGLVGLDVGASTGGFTQVLLERGATKVFAVDVGHNQLNWQIRSDSRVVVIEKVNARYLEFSQIAQLVDVIVVDVSFISLDKILPALIQFMHGATNLVTLIKPQFEVGRQEVGKGGIVTSVEARQRIVESIRIFGESLGLTRCGLIESPITGTDGNTEFLAHWKKSS